MFPLSCSRAPFEFVGAQNAESGPLSIRHGEFVAQDVVAMDLVNRGLAEPALTGHFTGRRRATRLHGIGQLFRSNQNPPGHIPVGTTDAKDRLRIGEVHSYLISLPLVTPSGL